MPYVAGAWDDLRAVADDAESGAAEIARRAAVTISALPRSDLVEAVRALARGHPAMAPVWRLGGTVLSAEDHAGAALAFAETVRREAEGVATIASGILPEEVITLSYSSTLVAAVSAAGVRARCARSAPGGEGSLTAERLRARGIDAHVLEDDEAVSMAASGASVVVGADALGPGGAVNKVGTGSLAGSALSGGASAFVVAGTSKLIGADLPASIPFERTPLDQFTAVITERGAFDPVETGREAVAHPVHPSLRDLL
jgi:hypothetical protein